MEELDSRKSSMDLHSDTEPTFYNLIKIDEDFTSKLKIPHFFVKKYGRILPRKSTLRTDQCRKSWRVGIEEIEKEYFFDVGWSKFAKDVDLKHGEYLMFRFLGDSVFSVTVYETTGCKKELYSGNYGDQEPQIFQVKVKTENDDTLAYREDRFNGGKKWSFTKELKRHHMERVAVPKDFAQGTGIATNRNIKLLDAQGRKWPARVTDRNIGAYGLTAGWHDFLVGNNVVIGTIVSFEFVSDSENIIDVRVLKVGGNEKELFSSVKKRSGKNQLSSTTITNDHEDNSTNLLLKFESEDEDRYAEEQRDPRVGQRWTFSKELEKRDAHILDIPEDFVMGTGIVRNKKILLLDAERRTWQVYVTERTSGVFAMTTGWFEFLIGNNVAIGSTISFEYVSDTENIVEVQVDNRGGNVKGLFSLAKRSPEKNRSFPSPKASVDLKQKIKVRNVKTNRANGSCRRLVKEIKKTDAYRLFVPKDFAFSTGIAKKSQIRLLDEKGRKWPVYINYNCSMVCMGGGWHDFLVGNEVVVGSTISFEPFAGSDNTIQARVLKNGRNEQELFSSINKARRKCQVFPSPETSVDAREKIKCPDRDIYKIDGSPRTLIKELKRHDAHRLYLPKVFAFNSGIVKKGRINLLDENGRKWSVYINRNNGLFCMTGGWYDFLIGNKIIVGSTISFELVAGSDITIQARLVKTGGNEKELFDSPKTKKPQLNSLPKKDSHAERKSRPKTEEDFTEQQDGSGVVKRWRFEKELKRHHAYLLDIPKDFAVHAGIAKNRKIKLQDAKGRLWPVSTTLRKCGSFALSTGWIDFLLGNTVVIGSTISLEFVSGSDNVIRARILKEGTDRKALFRYTKSGKERLICSTPCRPQDHTFNHGDKTRTEKHEGDNRISEQDGCQLGRKLQFSKKLKKHHSTILDIPTRFAVGTGISSNRKIEVRDAEGRKWPVSVVHRKCGMFALTGGWNDFLVGNEAAVGSVVEFEQVPGSDNVVEARIHKKGRRDAYFCKARKGKA